MYRSPVRPRVSIRSTRTNTATVNRSRSVSVFTAIIAVVVAIAGLRSTGIEPSSHTEPPGIALARAGRGTGGGVPTTSVSPGASRGPASLAPPSAIPGASAAPSAAPLPECRYADELAIDTNYDDWAHTVVDTISRLPKGYVPPDLVPVQRAGLAGGGTIRKVAIADLRALARAARKAGAELAVQSAYRSERRQRAVFAGWVRVSGETEARRYSARPGHSEHQLGTTIDFRAVGGGPPWYGDFAATPQGRWLTAHAWQFGWVMSYPKGADGETCYQGEAWHYRYVGRSIAAEVHGSVLTLRAWQWRTSTDQARP